MSGRTWFKIYSENWLRGSIRQDPLEVRAIFIDLLALANNSSFSDTGEVKFANGIGYTDEQLAGTMNIDVTLWIKAKKYLVKTERIIVSQHNEILVANWSKYQSEYKRQKRYRKTQS